MNTFTTRRRFAIAPDTAVICALVIISPQLFGGAFAWSVVVIAGLALLALATALWVRRASPTPVIDGLFVMMAVAWVWTCLQAVPIPSAVAQALGLSSVESAERLRGLAWTAEIPLTISYDPGSTQLEIVIGIAILAAFLAARLGGADGLKPLAVAVVVSAALIAFEGMAHSVSNAGALFGVYPPRFTAPQLLTPLMNNNHVAGFMVVGALIAVGLAAQAGRRMRSVWALAAGLCTLTAAWTLSRGAIGSWLFGFVLLAAWLIRDRESGRRGAVLSVGILGATVAGALAFAGLEPLMRRFETQGLDKLAVAARGFGLLDGSTWWLGVGRGAFSSVFAAEEGSLSRYTHPENILVQWTTEWGVPVALTLLWVLAFSLWKRLRGADEALVAATSIAILALTLQNFVDFSLEMAGIVVVVAALLGALLPVPDESASNPALRLPIAVFVVFAIALGLLGPRVHTSDTQSIVDRLTLAMKDDRKDDFVATLRRGLALHPGEPALALLAGTYAGSKRHPDTARWLSIVMEEAPGWGAPHAVAARWLSAAGKTDQALLEIREAEQRHAGRGHQMLCEILERFPRMEYVERAAPTEDRRIASLNRTAHCPRLPADLRAEIDSAILQGEPTHPWAVLREAQRLTDQERSSDAIALLQQAIEHHADNGRLWIALVAAHLKGDDPEQARLVLEEAMSADLATQPLLEAQARVEAALGQSDAMRATLTRLRGQARGEASLVASSFILEGNLEASLGNIDEALAAYAAADAANPNTPALQYAAALALRSGRPTHAHRTYRTLCRRKPDGPACAQEARLSKEPSSAPPERPMP